MLPQSIQAMNLFVDGKGYASVVEEITLPKLTVKTEEFRGGGMDLPIELATGMEKLECSFTTANYDKDLFKAYNLAPGKMVNITLRGALTEDGKTTEVVLALFGAWKEIDFGSWKPGEKTQMKVSIALKKYELRMDGEEVVFIDTLNMIRRINGEDALAEARSAIAM